MDGMTMSPPVAAAAVKKAKSHMTFFWGKDSQILFKDWPGTNGGMYALALIFVFVMAVLVEWLSRGKFIKDGRHGIFQAGLFRTIKYTIQMGLAYLLMLAVMSFNGGVLIVAVAGHALGFFLFGTNMFETSDAAEGNKGSSSSVC